MCKWYLSGGHVHQPMGKGDREAFFRAEHEMGEKGLRGSFLYFNSIVISSQLLYLVIN